MKNPPSTPATNPHTVISGTGSRHSNKDGKRPYLEIALDDIRRLVDDPQQGVEKAQAQWLIPSSLPSRVFKEQEANGQFWFLWADIDHNPPSLNRLAEVIRNAAPAIDFEIYTSRSATRDNPKSRVIIPIDKPLSGADWCDSQRALNAILQAAGITPDTANERHAQLCYLPNRGEFYEARSERNGRFLSPLDHWEGWIEVIRKEDQDAQDAIEIQRTAAIERRTKLTVNGHDLIGAFNATNDISDILIQAGYAQRGAHFRHPHSESGSFSASVKDGRVHTLSPADPLYTGGQGAHDAFSAFALLFHGGDQKAATKDAGNNWVMIGAESWNAVKRREFAEQKRQQRDEAEADPGRRDRQKAENRDIGEGQQAADFRVENLTLDAALERFAFLSHGSRVVDLTNTKLVLPYPDWAATFSASEIVTQDNGKPRATKVSRLWRDSPERVTRFTLTFKAGDHQFIVDPDGRPAVNTWRPLERSGPYADPTPFVDHVTWLFGEESGRFLDWLAHIEQHPGTLPHTAWLHIAPNTGMGRNWIAGVLSRVWAGHVAANFDLVQMLEKSFNSRLSQKLLAVVDEINEGGGHSSWKYSERLKSEINPEFRKINEKYGRESVEFNACRFLVFSNHKSAIPLDDNDRRINVALHEGDPRPEAYYSRLYGLLADPAFINGVTRYLGARDIRKFNPGAHSTRNRAREELIGASMTEVDYWAEQVISDWPADIIINAALAKILEDDPKYAGGLTAHHRKVLTRLGAAQGRKAVKFDRSMQRFTILRNAADWINADPHHIRAEIMRAKLDANTDPRILLGGGEK